MDALAASVAAGYSDQSAVAACGGSHGGFLTGDALLLLPSCIQKATPGPQHTPSESIHPATDEILLLSRVDCFCACHFCADAPAAA